MTMPPPPPGPPGSYPPPPGGAPTVVPGGPPSPDRGRARRWPVLVAAAAVLLLLVGAAVVWAVLSGDDDEGAGGDAAGGGAEGEPMVTGDLDGNGYGDMLVVQVRADSSTPTRVWRMLSDGSELADPVDAEPGNGQWLDLADVDGDGLADEVWTPLTGDDDTAMTVHVVPGEGDPWTADVPIDRALLGDQPEASTGDVDGDGRSDLILVNSWIEGGTLGVHVALAEDEGFGELTQWYSAPTGSRFWGAEVGDGNGDGLADVFALTMWEKEGDEGNFENDLQLLTSDGSELTAAADPVQVWGLGLQRNLQGVGDFDGDGDDEPLLANPEGLFTIDVTGEGDDAPQQVYEHDLPEKEWRQSLRDYVYANEFWSVTDADGDGADDVVHMRPDGKGAAIDVYAGSADGFAAPEQWGFFPCTDDTCGDSWKMPAPAR